MTLIACIDPKRHMSFNGRRLTRDKQLLMHILLITSGKELYVSEYTHKLLQSSHVLDHRTVLLNISSPSPPLQLPDDAFCLIELERPEDYLQTADRVVLYTWDKEYPSDGHLFPDLSTDSAWCLTNIREIPGSSHETIKEEIYVRV